MVAFRNLRMRLKKVELQRSLLLVLWNSACFVGSSVIYTNASELMEQYSDRCTLGCSNIVCINSLHHVCQHSVLGFPLSTVTGCIVCEVGYRQSVIWRGLGFLSSRRRMLVQRREMVLPLTVTCFSWYCNWLSLAFHGTAIDSLFMVLR